MTAASLRDDRNDDSDDLVGDAIFVLDYLLTGETRSSGEDSVDTDGRSSQEHLVLEFL